MNDLQILFTTRYQTTIRTVKTAFQSRLRAYVLVTSASIFWIGIFAIFWRGFHFFSKHIPESFFGIITDYIFSMFYFTLFTMLFFSSLLISVSLFFKNNETKFLMTCPIRHENIFLYKLSETFAFASWAVFFLGLPVAFAYGIQQNVTLWFYPLITLSFIPFIIIPCILGSIASFFIVLYIAKYKKVIGIIFSLFLITGIIYLIYSISTEKQNTPVYSAVWLFNILGYFGFTKWPFSPSLWISESMLAAAHGDFTEYLFFFSLLVSTSLMLIIASYWFASFNYGAAWSKLHSDLHTKKIWKLSFLKKLLGNLFFLSPRARLFLEKDLKIFIRDPIQWSQFAILLGLLLLYILNLRTLKYDQNSEFWRQIIATLNLMATSLTACTFASRFIFPMLSLEGKRFWTLGVMPIKRWSIIMAKFAFALGILIIITQILVILSAVMLRFPLQLTLFHSAIALMIVMGIAGLSVGLGAIYPNFREDNPSKIVSGFGGTLNLVISLVYVMIMVFLQAVPSHLILKETFYTPMFITLILASVLVTILTTMIPIVLGIKKFTKMEM